MKRIILAIGMIATSLFVKAQCFTVPTCTQTVNVFGGLGNASYNGSVCFVDVKQNGNGKETISNSVNWNNWNYLSFKGYFNVVQTINMNGGKKLYFSNGESKVHNLSMSGNDTIYVDGILEIDNYVANNGGNVIVLATNARVVVNGQTYTKRTDIPSSSGNLSNVLQIIPCSDPALPVSFTEISVRYLGNNKALVTFAYNDALNVQKFEIMLSKDLGKTFKPVTIILPDDSKSGKYSVTINLK